jgi:hypothetical protein
LEDALSDARAELAREQVALSCAERQLAKRDEVLSRIRASHTWRLACALRRLQGMADGLRPLSRRIGRRLHLPLADDFRGALESPAEGARLSKELKVEGWVFSGGGQVTRVEAFLGGDYLGAVGYGTERPDVAAAQGPQAPAACGFVVLLPLVGVRPGPARLTVRVVDERGREQRYERMVVVK